MRWHFPPEPVSYLLVQIPGLADSAVGAIAAVLGGICLTLLILFIRAKLLQSIANRKVMPAAGALLTLAQLVLGPVVVESLHTCDIDGSMLPYALPLTRTCRQGKLRVPANLQRPNQTPNLHGYSCSVQYAAHMCMRMLRITVDTPSRCSSSRNPRCGFSGDSSFMVHAFIRMD